MFTLRTARIAIKQMANHKRPRQYYQSRPSYIYFSSKSNDDDNNNTSKQSITESSETKRLRLLSQLPLHKEELNLKIPSSAPTSLSKSIEPTEPTESTTDDFPTPKPMTVWDGLDIFNFDETSKYKAEIDANDPNKSSGGFDTVKAQARYQQLKREDSRQAGMDAKDIAAYEAIERKEKEKLEAAMLLQQPELSYNAVMRALVGNTFITILKFAVYLRTGSAAMLSESIHTLVDSGNQAILLIGIRQLSNPSDKRHPYGYGRAAYFWGLVSALGMFWVGSGISLIHGVNELLHPPTVLVEPGWETWSTLGISFGIDGYVLYKTVNGKDILQVFLIFLIF